MTDCPAVSEAKLQVSETGLKVTPVGRPVLVMFVSPWVGRVSTTFTFEASDGPVLTATTV